MSSLQRLCLIVGLVVAALLLHFVYCSWAFGAQMYGNTEVMLGWSSDHTSARFNVPLARFYGIVAPSGTKREALFGGVLGPWLLLVPAVFLLLGWKGAARRGRGACLKCGYALKYDYESGCPECGWRRIDSGAATRG